MRRVVPAHLIAELAAEYKPEGKAAPKPSPAAKAAAPTEAKTSPARPAAEPRPAPGPRASDNRVARCRGYLKKMPPSVQGMEGSKRIFHAARVIWNDFEVDGEEGYALLEEYNRNSQPPWDEEGTQGLRRKWNEAIEKGPDNRGHRLKEERPGFNQPRTPPPRRDPAAAPVAGELPTIVHNKRQYTDVDAEALAALVAANDPPAVFVGNGCGLVDLVRGGRGDPLAARELDGAAMRTVLGRVALWQKVRKTEKGDEVFEDDFPPQALLSSFAVRGEWPGVPYLRAIVTYPVFTPNWEFLAASGYHSESELFLDLGSLEVRAPALVPTEADVAAARELIVGDMLGDFPFAADNGASRANAVGMFVLPMIRHAIDGPTPINVIDAPSEGTGKSLLAEVVTVATVGEEPEAMSPDIPEEEWNKTLLAVLNAGDPIVYLDNANRKLDSASLASAVTARSKRGRILGLTQMGRARVNVCWILTANNFLCSRELGRRVCWSRLDAGVENPADRRTFRHPKLLAWVRANRPRLLHAIAVLVQNWIAKGKPPGTRSLGKFEAWADAVGGILAAAGIDGFLGNLDAFRRNCADQVSEMPEFVRAWWALHNSMPVISGDLYNAARDTLETVLTAETEDGRKKQLGRHLVKVRDRVFGEFRIRRCTKADGSEDKDYAGRPRYRLEKVNGTTADEVRPPMPVPEDDEDEFEMRG